MENQNIEYKESWRDEYLKWVCGFANAQGGKLYIGIDDKGNVCGVENAHRLSEDIPNKIVALLGVVADVNIRNRDGELPPAITPENIENVHASYPRNKNLAFAFYKAGFIESWGRGWKKICDGFLAAGLPKPTIESAQGGVLVTFQRNNVNLPKQNPIDAQNVAVNVAEELTERQRIIIELIEKGVVDNVAHNVAVNTKYLSEKLNVNRKTIQRDMAYLQERKLIQWVGPDKGGHWEIIKEG